MNRAPSASRAQFIQSLLIVVLTAAAFLGGLVYVKSRDREDTANRQIDDIADIQINAVLEQLARQTIVDEDLRAELSAGGRSFEQPLVILDPYGDSPLTAVILFETERASRIAVEVEGVTDACSVSFVFDDYRTKHLLPVYGLYADRENRVVLSATDQDGMTRRSSLKIQTDVLPPELKEVVVDILKSDTTQSQPGFTFMHASNPKFAFDSEGDIRWFLSLPTLQSVLYDFGGRIVLAAGDVYCGETLVFEADLIGRLYSVNLAPYGVHHDIEEAGDRRLLVAGSNPGPTVEDLVYELDPSTGKIDVVLDFAKILDPERPSVYWTAQNWMHMNAVTWSESDNSIIVSSRVQSAVIKVSYPEGEIRWILGNHDNWLPEYVKYLLTPTGEALEWQNVQHSPVIMPDQDGNPGTVDILLFDNHRSMQEKPAVGLETLYSRLVQYRIDETAMTVEQIWEFGKERGRDLFAAFRSSVDCLPNGNILGYFSLAHGHRVGYSRIVELRYDTQEVVLDVVIYRKTGDSMADYRVTRRELYSQSDNDLCDLEPCRENIPQDMAERAHAP